MKVVHIKSSDLLVVQCSGIGLALQFRTALEREGSAVMDAEELSFSWELHRRLDAIS